jgi:hypothetical protein
MSAPTTKSLSANHKACRRLGKTQSQWLKAKLSNYFTGVWGIVYLQSHA